MTATLAFGYPLGRWAVAADRRPVHEVSSRNRWGDGFGAQVLKPLWPPDAKRPVRQRVDRQLGPGFRLPASGWP
jgi:hypothetical protein